jgi:uncharacterized sulfatase
MFPGKTFSLFLCLLSLTLLPGADGEQDGLNVLFISVDDLNTDIGCYGADHVKTPSMDRLARTGVRFDRAYCQVAVCGASRQSLMFGLRPNTTGVHRLTGSARTNNPSAVSLPELFRKKGIYTARVGKIYHYMNPSAIGTNGHDDEPSWSERFNPAGIDKKRQSEILVSRKGKWEKAGKQRLGASHSWWDPESEDDDHTDGMVAAKVVDLIEKHRDERFFIAAGFFKPHCPYVAPRKYFEMYPLEKVAVPDMKAELEDRADIPPEAYPQKHHRVENLPIEHIRRLRQAYYATTTFLDAQVGRVLDALEKNGLAEKTIVVFWSDHGYFLGEKALWYKFKNFERALRAPLIISAPGMARGECRRIVEFLDIYPTVADLAGLKPLSKLEGVSLRPLMENPAAEWARPAIGQNATGYSIRTAKYRFTRYGDGKEKWELYDHTADPGERCNLIRQGKLIDVAGELNERLKPFMSGGK